MPTTLYNRGLDELRNFTSDTFEALLINDAGYVPNPDHDYVADLTPGTNEIAGAGYSRQTLGTKTRTIDDGADRIVYDCADFDFGTIAAGENVTAMVVYRFVTNDADSILIAYYPLGTIATTGLSFPVIVNASGLLYTDQGA